MVDEKTQSKTALITGASAGIGYELSKLFAADNYDLILVARDSNRLARVAKELEASFACRVAVLPKDLTVTRSPDEIFEQLQNNAVEIDVLVNNAGVGARGALHESDTQKMLDMIQLNVVALVHLTRLVLPGMVQRGTGRILNVSSVAAYQPGPFKAIYNASKAFVTFFSEAVSTELKGTGVTLTTLAPGPTVTEFHERAGMQRSKLANKAGLVMTAAQVAKIGYDATMSGKRTVITGLRNRAGALVLGRLLPRGFVLDLMSKINGGR